MYQKERLENILQLVKQYGYVTVKYLVSSLHYSNATVNRDLNALVAQGSVRRSYGGVEYIDKKGVPLPFRYHFMRTEKLKIGKKAAEFVRDGDTVFIDASTTAECMTEFLIDKKIERRARLSLPVCAIGSEVLFVAGVEISSSVAVKGNNAYQITYQGRTKEK